MLIAKQKRNENIAGYILYLYQIEDLIRAFHLDMDLINKNLVGSYDTEKEKRSEISAWYENLVMMIKKEGKQEKGHLQFLINQITELNEFHLQLLQSNAVESYLSVFQTVTELLKELKQKNSDAAGDVQLAIDGVYGYLLLKIQKKEISPDTDEAVKRLSNWLARLSDYFKDFESGDLDI